MAVTSTTIDNALKDVYENIVRDQLNINTNILYNKIGTTEKHIDTVGRKIVKAVPYGVNGGVAAGTESGALPTSGGNYYENFEQTLKYQYGVIELTDYVMRATKSNRGAFVDALTSEMEGLLKSAKYNYSRQCYMDGVGKIGLCDTTSASLTVQLQSSPGTKYLREGQIIDILDSGGSAISNGSARRIANVDRINYTITLSGTSTVTTADTDFITMQGSYGLELTGLDKIFQTTGSLYGLDRATYSWMIPKINTSFGTLSDKSIARARIDTENISGGTIDLLLCGTDVETEYFEYLENTRRNVEPTATLEGGFKALNCSGLPLVSDRDCPDTTMYMLDTTVFAMHNMADWEWMDEDGKILKKVAGYPTWQATMVKYGDMICDHPAAQIELSGITIS